MNLNKTINDLEKEKDKLHKQGYYSDNDYFEGLSKFEKKQFKHKELQAELKIYKEWLEDKKSMLQKINDGLIKVLNIIDMVDLNLKHTQNVIIKSRILKFFDSLKKELRK